MKSNKFLHFITCVMMFFLMENAKAGVLGEREAINFAENKGKELFEVFQENDLVKRYQLLDGMISEYIDIKFIGRFLVGKYWKSMTETQKNTYEELFLRYGLAMYKTLPLEYAKNIKYKIVGSEASGDSVNVVANVVFGDEKNLQKISVSFKLHKVGEKIKIIDVKIAESSLILSYRSKFYEMIAQCDGEIDWFLEDLADIVLSLENNLKQNLSN